MTKRYGDCSPEGQLTEASESGSTAEQAVAGGRLVLAADPDGLWALRWTESPAAPRRALTPGDATPLDQAYRLARHLRDEAGSSAVSLTLGEAPSLAPVSSTTSSSTTPVKTFQIALRCPDQAALAAWAQDRLGVSTWNEIATDTRVEASTSTGHTGGRNDTDGKARGALKDPWPPASDDPTG